MAETFFLYRRIVKVNVERQRHSQSKESLVEGPREEGIQEILVDQRQSQNTPTKPEPAQKHTETGLTHNYKSNAMKLFRSHHMRLP